MMILVIVIGILLLFQICVLATFICVGRNQTFPAHTISSNLVVDIRNQVDVIIAAREEVPVIRRCLRSLHCLGFKNVYVCIDGGDVDTVKLLQFDFPFYNIIFNSSIQGKIQSQVNCFEKSTSSHILILDADITLIDEEIDDFLYYYFKSSCDFLCPYSTGVYVKKNWLSNLAECDRIYRQRIVRAGRDTYGVSNLSGYCMLANKKKYLEIIDSRSIQDDVAATIRLLKKNYVVASYHRSVCTEIERPTLRSYLLQKTRWTAGNILLIPAYRNLFSFAPWSKAFAFSSSFLLWYWCYWIDVIAFIIAFFYPFFFVALLVEGATRYIGLRMVIKNNIHLKVIPYIFLWPLLSFICLLLSPYFILGLISDKSTRR